MRKVEAVLKDGKYGVIDDGEEFVPFIYDSAAEAIAEWAWFERDNLKREPHRRFLPRVTPLEFIEEVERKYNEHH